KKRRQSPNEELLLTGIASHSRSGWCTGASDGMCIVGAIAKSDASAKHDSNARQPAAAHDWCAPDSNDAHHHRTGDRTGEKEQPHAASQPHADLPEQRAGGYGQSAAQPGVVMGHAISSAIYAGPVDKQLHRQHGAVRHGTGISVRAWQEAPA